MAHFFLKAQTETIKTLQNEIESLTVERNFFRETYESQIIQIQKLEKELKKSNSVNTRLRGQLIQNITPVKSNSNNSKSRSGNRRSLGLVESSLDKIESSLSKIEASFSDDDIELGPEEEEVVSSSNDGSDCSTRDPIAIDEKKKDNESFDTDSETISSCDTDHTGNDNDEDGIRDHAQKMLLWADYSCASGSNNGDALTSSNHSSILSSKLEYNNNEERTTMISNEIKEGDNLAEDKNSSMPKTEGDDDDVDDVRNRAAKLLIWANYSEAQTDSVCLD